MTPSGSYESSYSSSGISSGMSSGVSTPRRSSSLGMVDLTESGEREHKKKKKMLRKSWGNSGGAEKGEKGEKSEREKEEGRERKRQMKKNLKREFGFDALGANDIVGIVMIEILGAVDLPKLKNSTSPPFPLLRCA